MTTFAGPSADSEPGIGALTLGGLLAETAAAHRGREALVFREPDGSGSVRWTYEDLLQESRTMARALLAAGMVKGTRVALLMGNRPTWVSAAFGAAMAGGVVVPVNTYFEAMEVEYVLRHSDAAILLMQEELAGHAYLEGVKLVCPSLPSPQLPFLRRVACLGTDSWDELVGQADDVPEADLDACMAQVSPFDDAMIIYTSGTQSHPKGVLHAHRPPALQSWRFARLLGLDETTRAWSAFPLFWTAGFCMVMGATLAAGGCLVMQDRFEPGEALELLQSEAVTAAHAWPHQMAALEGHPAWGAADLSSLRQVDASSAFARHPTVRPPESPWSPRAAYGLTETFTVVTSYPSDTPPEERGESQGPVLPGSVVRIVDPATGEELPAGGHGEIAVKGTTLMKGYVKVAPEECFDPEGFFRTGDAGYFDDQGRLHWSGRISELIKTGGANVSPVEIEEILIEHPGLKAARVVGVPDPVFGEVVVLCAVAQEGWRMTEDEVIGFLKGRLASYKIPRRVLFVSDDELSMTANAKIRSAALRQLAAERLAGGG